MADQALIATMASMVIHPGTDCSEIASWLQASVGGRGEILHITPARSGMLSLTEYGITEEGFHYHDVFTDGGFAYDPRFSLDAVPLKDYLDGIQLLNPGATVVSR